jgi:hypothetical protein
MIQVIRSPVIVIIRRSRRRSLTGHDEGEIQGMYQEFWSGNFLQNVYFEDSILCCMVGSVEPTKELVS